jgi:hypothetical protein
MQTAAPPLDGRLFTTANFLSFTEENLAKVVERLKRLLIESISNRKKRSRTLRRALRPVTSVTAWSNHSRIASMTRRPASGCLKGRNFDAHYTDPSDIYASSESLIKRFICSPSFLVQPQARQASGHPATVDTSQVRPTSPAVMNRLSLKLNGRAPKRSAAEEHHAQSSSRNKRQQEIFSVDSDDPECEDDMDTMINKLRVKIREVRVAEERMIRDFHYNPKQLLTQFYDFGTKAKSNARSASCTSDPCKELANLIECVDSNLSTNEALAVLKEIGIEYQPRSAAGRKNVMATDLSLALAPNGLKLNAQEVTVSPERKSIIGKDAGQKVSKDPDDRSSHDDFALDTNRSSFH